MKWTTKKQGVLALFDVMTVCACIYVLMLCCVMALARLAFSRVKDGLQGDLLYA